MNDDNKLPYVISAVSLAISGVFVFRYFNQKKTKIENHSIVIYLDKPNIQDDIINNNQQELYLFDLGEQSTFQDLKDQITKRLNINNPRLFNHSTGKEILDNDFNNILHLIAIVTSDNKPLMYSCKGLLPIPNGPPTKPWIGNLMDFVPNFAKSSRKLFKEYGPIFKIYLPSAGGKPMIFIADAEFAEQILSNPSIWPKLHMKNFKKIRNQIGNGLFTSDDDEEIWATAHRILLPAFSSNGMKKYFDMVTETANDLNNVFDKISTSQSVIDINEWAARFTLEVIGKVAFGVSFNSFDERPSFLEDLEDAFCENLLNVWQRFIPSPSRTIKVKKAWNNIYEFIQSIIDRKRNEIQNDESAKEKKDLITLMLCAEDPKTKLKLPNDNIRSQVLTFLVAGHDSTSSAITSLLYHISIHPEVEEKIMQELVSVIGNNTLEWKHLSQLTYCTQVIKENLRLFPPAGQIRKTAGEDTTIGPYSVKKGTQTFISFWALHHNPKYWPNPDNFNPERFSPENSKNRNPYAWLPFSIGPRSCIGQQLSIMEQKVFLALIFRKYCFRLHATANITITFPLFVKPNGVNMVVSKRPILTSSMNIQDNIINTNINNSDNPSKDLNEIVNISDSNLQQNYYLYILYGSNMGTSTSFAQQIESQACDLGFKTSLMSLDDFIDDSNILSNILSEPNKHSIIILSSTYNGEPPDNAIKFKKWISNDNNTNILSGLNYCVFGCGNSQWRTFQMFPNYIDNKLNELGGTRICKLGQGDADKSIEDDFTKWSLTMWVQVFSNFGLNQTSKDFEKRGFITYSIKYVDNFDNIFDKYQFYNISDNAKSHNSFNGEIIKNNELQNINESNRSTRHIEIKIPDNNIQYQTGDHLGVYACNSLDIIEKLALLLDLDINKVIIISSSSSNNRGLPLNIPISIKDLLECFIDIQGPINRNQLLYLAKKARCPPEEKLLNDIASTNNHDILDSNKVNTLQTFEEYIINSKRTIIDILEEFSSIKITLEELLSIISILKPRYYSISSSSKQYPNIIHLSVGIVSYKTNIGRQLLGTCSNYLNNTSLNDKICIFIKDTKSSFRLPLDNSIPIILIGAGTGIAPLRGFLQERQINKATGQGLLFFGCRNDYDYIYKDELTSFVSDNTLTNLYIAFSRKQSTKVYVQHKIIENANKVYEMLQNGAYIYVCGDAKEMAPAVRNAFCSVVQQKQGISYPLAEQYISHLCHSGRYNEDVWAS